MQTNIGIIVSESKKATLILRVFVFRIVQKWISPLMKRCLNNLN